MVARTMEAFCTESTRLRDAIGNDEPPDQYGGVEWLLNEELLATADPPPFSWKDLLALLDQQRIVWISSRVFLVRENLIHDGRAFSDWVGGGGYACLFGIGGSTAGDYISLYAAAERTPAQTTTARNFLVDLFCLGEGDSAVLVGSGGDSDEGVLLHFVSKRSEDIASLHGLHLFEVWLTVTSCQALGTLSEAADSRLEIGLKQCDIPNTAGDAFLSYLQQGHGWTTLKYCTLPPRVLSQGLRASTRLKEVVLDLSSLRHARSSIEDSMTELAQGLANNEGLEVLQLEENTGDLAGSDACLRILCEGLATHPTMHVLDLCNFFLLDTPLPLEGKERRFRYVQQLLKSNTVLRHVRLSEDEMNEPFYAEFIRPCLEINRCRIQFLAVRDDPLWAKLLAPTLVAISSLSRRNRGGTNVNLIHFFLSENRGFLIDAVLAVVPT